MTFTNKNPLIREEISRNKFASEKNQFRSCDTVCILKLNFVFLVVNAFRSKCNFEKYFFNKYTIYEIDRCAFHLRPNDDINTYVWIISLEKFTLSIRNRILKEIDGYPSGRQHATKVHHRSCRMHFFRRDCYFTF